jgi:hypothetical protein
MGGICLLTESEDVFMKSVVVCGRCLPRLGTARRGSAGGTAGVAPQLDRANRGPSTAATGLPSSLFQAPFSSYVAVLVGDILHLVPLSVIWLDFLLCLPLNI